MNTEHDNMGKKSKKKYTSEEVKRCDECNQELPKGRFSSKQWKLSKGPCCKSCVDKIEAEVDSKLNALLAEDDSISDEDLFKEPPPKDDCPICLLRLPLDEVLCSYQACCGQLLCGGCMSEMILSSEDSNKQLCPLCRAPEGGEHLATKYKRRAELNDPHGLLNLGCTYANGRLGLPQDHLRALLYFIRAGELGNGEAFAIIATSFKNGTSGVNKDTVKATHFYKRAAILGHHVARYNLGIIEVEATNFARAKKHLKISAKIGYKPSLDSLRKMFTYGLLVTKDEYEEALRAHHESLSQMKSDKRDEADPMIRRGVKLL